MVATAQHLTAKRLLKSFDLPAEARRVLTEPQCHTEELYLLFLDACDQVLYDDPRAGFPMAETALELVGLVPVEACRGGELRKRELEIRGLALLAGAHRAIGELDKADEIYDTALELCHELPIAVREKANLLRRLTVLRIDQGRLDEALELARSAVEISQQGNGFEDRQSLAWALTLEGGVQLELGHSAEAIQLLTEALRFADPRRSPRTHLSILKNISVALVRGGSHPADLAAALGYLRKARRRLRSGRRSLPKLKLRWAEGLILVKFGSTRRAEAALQGVREGLLELGTPYEVAMISLDLSAIYLDEGRYADVRELAAETFRIFQSMRVDREANAALLLWQSGARAEELTSELLLGVRETLLARSAAHR